MERQDLDVWIGGLVHAVNNPLTYALTNLSSLRRDLEDLVNILDAAEVLLPRLGPECAAEVARVRRLRADLAMDRPAEVIGDLMRDTQDGLRHIQTILKATRPMARWWSETECALDSTELLETAASELRRALPAGVALTVDFGTPWKFQGGRLAWEGTLHALLDNARIAVTGRSGPAGPVAGQIRVTASARSVIVEDNGPGISPTLGDRIFLPYFTTRPGAAGLGLAMAAQVSRATGGDIEVVGAGGRLGGACIKLTLPPA